MKKINKLKYHIEIRKWINGSVLVAKCLNRQLSTKLALCVLLHEYGNGTRLSSNSRCWFIILVFFVYLEHFLYFFSLIPSKLLLLMLMLLPIAVIISRRYSYFIRCFSFKISSILLPFSLFPSRSPDLSHSLSCHHRCAVVKPVNNNSGIVPRVHIHTAMANINNYRACLYYQK